MEVEFQSNIRVGIEHKVDNTLTLGAQKDFHNEYESHILTFERYVRMPQEMRVLKKKLD